MTRKSPKAALDSQPPHWTVGRGRPRMTAGKTAWGGTHCGGRKQESESEDSRLGFDSPRPTLENEYNVKND